MNNCIPTIENQAVPYAVDDSNDQLSAYGSIPALKEIWQQIGGEVVLQQANVRYGQGVDKVPDLSFLLLSTPFVAAASQRRVTQRFGGEPSVREADPLLAQQTDHDISQRTLNRFVNKDRYDWLEVQAARIQQMQQGCSLRPLWPLAGANHLTAASADSLSPHFFQQPPSR